MTEHPHYLLTPEAEQDLDDIDIYITARHPIGAVNLIDQLFAAFALLGERPMIGHYRRDLTRLDVRFWTVSRRYMIIYEDKRRPILILRILTAEQDIARKTL